MSTQTTTDTLRCVLYTRVSTKQQAEEEIPIEGQVEECQKYAQSKGWQVVKVYTDAGYSGGQIDRPGFQDMYHEAKQKPRPFDVILTWRTNRLFRDLEARLFYFRNIRSAGVKIVSLQEPELAGAAGEMMEGVIGLFDQYYRAQISEDTLRGMKLVAQRGYSTGGRPPRGYRNDRKPTGRTKPNGDLEMRTVWVPDADMWPSVVKAFEMYAAGHTLAQIAEATKITAAKNGLSTLLRNRAYLGERIYNTTRRASLHDKKYKRLKNNPDDFVIVNDDHEAIVSQDLFYQVQAVLDAKRPTFNGRTRTSPRHYVLSGLLWCAEHKEPYAGYTTGQNDYYACALRRKHGKAKYACTLYKKDALERFIIDSLKTDVFTRERIKAGLDYLAAERAKNEAHDDAALKTIKAEIQDVDRKLERYHDAIEGGVKVAAVTKPMNELSDKRLSLEKRLADLEEQQRKARKIPEATEKMVTQVMTNINAILETKDPDELKAALAHFIARIDLNGEDIEMSHTFDFGNGLALNWRPRGVDTKKLNPIVRKLRLVVGIIARSNPARMVK